MESDDWLASSWLAAVSPLLLSKERLNSSSTESGLPRQLFLSTPSRITSSSFSTFSTRFSFLIAFSSSEQSPWRLSETIFIRGMKPISTSLGFQSGSTGGKSDVGFIHSKSALREEKAGTKVRKWVTEIKQVSEAESKVCGSVSMTHPPIFSSPRMSPFGDSFSTIRSRNLPRNCAGVNQRGGSGSLFSWNSACSRNTTSTRVVTSSRRVFLTTTA